MEKSQNQKNETTRDYLHRHLDISDLVKRLITKRKDQLASKYVSLLKTLKKYRGLKIWNAQALLRQFVSGHYESELQITSVFCQEKAW